MHNSVFLGVRTAAVLEKDVLNVLDSDKFSNVHNGLLKVWFNYIEIYTNGSLKSAGSNEVTGETAAYFPAVNADIKIKATVGCSIAIMKKTVKDFGFDTVSESVVSKKREKEFETNNTIKSDNVNMEKKFLVKETNINYDKKDVLEEKNMNQIPKKSKLSFALDISLDNIVEKLVQEKLVVIKKLFSKVNGFGGAFTSSKFAGIIRVTFTFESSLDWAVVIREISVGTLTETVYTALSNLVGGKTCVINCYPVIYTWARCVIVCFDSVAFLDVIIGTTLIKLSLPIVNKLKLCLVNIESNLTSLAGQISKLNQMDNVVIREGLGKTASGKTAAVLDLSAFSEVVKLENMLEGLSASVLSLSAYFNSLVLAGGINNSAKQKDVIHWHKDINNIISIVFTFGLDSSYLGSEVAIVMNVVLAKHVCKVSKILSWLFSIKLFFKNKLSVSILGLYVEVFLAICFSQAGKINFLIAKTVNKSFFIILNRNFNKNSLYRCASFKKCLSLGLINSLAGSLVANKPTWENSRGIIKTIDYVFIFSNLINLIVNYNIDNIGKYFDINHQAVSVSSNFREAMAVNTVMFSKEFITFKKFLDLNAIVKTLVIQNLVDSGVNLDYVYSVLCGLRKMYYVSKLAELLRAKKIGIKSAIDKQIVSFVVNKDYTI
ncbi:hypothetical protein G9A89_015163 [Geosiphon pyriformis]|nr:hypothetical protein G9A89_015163 [Geosiphon pyriformis]